MTLPLERGVVEVDERLTALFDLDYGEDGNVTINNIKKSVEGQACCTAGRVDNSRRRAFSACGITSECHRMTSNDQFYYGSTMKNPMSVVLHEEETLTGGTARFATANGDVDKRAAELFFHRDRGMLGTGGRPANKDVVYDTCRICRPNSGDEQM